MTSVLFMQTAGTYPEACNPSFGKKSTEDGSTLPKSARLLNSISHFFQETDYLEDIY